MTAAASALAGTPIAVSDSRVRDLASTWAWAGVCLWIVLSPFEATEPLVRLPGQSISSAEAALLAVFVVWAGTMAAVFASSIGWRALASSVRTPLTVPWLVFLVAASAAALLAPSDRTNALHMAGRFALAFGVFLVTVNGVTSLRRLEGLFAIAAVTGVVISILAALEFIGVPGVLRFLTLFRPGIAVVGAQVRAAGPFQYPTIASMYLEVLFAFGVVLMAIAIDERQSARAIAVGVALALMAEAVILTFTRSGVITLGTSLLIAGVVRWRTRGFDAAAKAMAAVAVVIAVELLSSRSLDAVRLRMTTEGQENWFQASVDAPAELSMTTGGTITVPLTLTNTGLTTWDSRAAQPFRLAYHWLLPDLDRAIDFEGLRTEFAASVRPGSTVTVAARVRAPRQPGRYRLMWDVVEEGRLWFSTERDAEITFTPVTVSGPPTGAMSAAVSLWLPKGPARPGRFKLWRAAWLMWRARPLAGVGPDNFRLLYGPYAALLNPDNRVHSNDMYLEILVGGGLLMAIPFAWVCWRVAGLVLSTVRHAPPGDTAMTAAGVAAAAVAIGIHGIVDSFLSFTATYVLFAITLGLVVVSNRLVAGHAHRI